MKLLQLIVACALFAAPAVGGAQPNLLAPATVQEAPTQPEAAYVHLRGVLEVALDGHPQSFVFVLSNGDIRAIGAVECFATPACRALIKELGAHGDIAVLNLKTRKA